MSKYIVGSENSRDKFEFNSIRELYSFLCGTLPDYEAASICRWVEKMKPGEKETTWIWGPNYIQCL